MSFALWKIGCRMDINKGTYKAGVSYVLAYQVFNDRWSSLNTISTPKPPHSFFQSQVSIQGSINHHHHTSPHHHHTIAQSTGQLPLGTVSRPVAPSYVRTLTPGGKREGPISLSSLSETQERSIANKSAYVSIDQPYTLQRFYITTRSAFLADRRQLG
jgi:hypothetical protein